MRRFSILCSYVAGLAFIVSGFFKLLDPIGTGFIMEEYFRFLHLGFLRGIAVAAGIAVSAIEFILGGLLVIRFKMRFTAVAALVMMAFYMLLTLFLAIFNPPMDCGCFGEAVHLTHLQTFIKNIVLGLICLPPFFKRDSIEYTCRKWHVVYRLVLLAIPVIGLPLQSLLYRPFLDFTDYKPSTVLSDGASGQADYSSAMSFVYEKGGERRSFGLDNLPDSTWTYVETVTVPVEDQGDDGMPLPLRDEEGKYVSDLFAHEKTMLISVYDPAAFDMDDWMTVKIFGDSVSAAGMSVIVALAATEEEGRRISEMIRYPVCYSDYKTLITLNRSNGGFTYVANLSYPTIVGKWAYRLMETGAPAMIAVEDPDVMLMHATIRRNSFMRIVALAYIVLMIV